MPRSTEKGIPSPLHSLPPNPTAHYSYESGLQCLGPVPVPGASLSCYVALNSHMTSLCYQLILTALSPWFSGLMHAEQGPAPKYSTTTKDLYTFTQFSHLCDLERT